MSATKTPAKATEIYADEDDIFNASEFDLPVPALDGYKADQIRIRFVGVCDLDRTSQEDLDFIEALRLGKPVRLIVSGRVAGKGFSHNGDQKRRGERRLLLQRADRRRGGR